MLQRKKKNHQKKHQKLQPMNELTQPILSNTPYPPHDVLSLSQFLDLLREEEDYYPGEQTNTKLMITRLRKIFYDKGGWNTQLIRKAAAIECRYDDKIVDSSEECDHSILEFSKVRRYKNNKAASKYRSVQYKKNDRVHPELAGKMPEIYKTHHQEVCLPDSHICDIGHVLVALDALNHPQVVSPLPDSLFFLHKLFPHVGSNVDLGTWLGDIASSAEDFLWTYLHYKRPLTMQEEQNHIDVDAPGSDMLGNIDGYVIGHCYDIKSASGKRVTDILDEYYNGSPGTEQKSKLRFKIFCELIGLKGFDGQKFSNETEWISSYMKQLRNATAFTTFSNTEETLKSICIPIKIWRNKYGSVLKLEILLQIFLKALKKLL